MPSVSPCPWVGIAMGRGGVQAVCSREGFRRSLGHLAEGKGDVRGLCRCLGPAENYDGQFQEHEG